DLAVGQDREQLVDAGMVRGQAWRRRIGQGVARGKGRHANTLGVMGAAPLRAANPLGPSPRGVMRGDSLRATEPPIRPIAAHQLQSIQVMAVDPYHRCLSNVRARSWPASVSAGPRESATYSTVNWCARDRND